MFARVSGRRVLLLGAVILAFVWPGSAIASPLELYSFGARSSGMAGGGVATSHSFDCVYLNPAGLGSIRRKYIAGGLSFGKLDLKINGESSGAQSTIGTTFGVIVPMALRGRLKDRLTLGLGILVPQRAVARARAPQIGEATFALLDSRSEVVGIQVALGYVLSERWSLGLGVLALGTLEGDIQVDVDGAGRFITRSEQKLKSDYAPVLGIRYADPSARWRTGLSVRGSSSAGFDIEIKNSLGMSLPLSLPALQIVGVPQYDPASAAAELAYQARPDLSLALQLEYKRWSAYPLPTENPLPAGEALPGADFHDTLVPRVSGEWIRNYGATQLAARAGYAFLYSPAPEMRGPQSLLDNHRHQGAMGLGLAWPDTDYPFQFDLWMQVHQLVSRTHTKEAALFEDPEAATLDPLRGSGRIAIGGFSLGVEL